MFFNNVFFKLFSQYEKFSQIEAVLRSEECNLDDMIARSVQDYSKAQNDILLSKEIKLEIKQLEANLASEKVSLQSMVEHLQESHKSGIQVPDFVKKCFKHTFIWKIEQLIVLKFKSTVMNDK